jgi:uncharacterized protein YlaI
MEIKCNECNKVFELDTDGFEKEQVESDSYSIRYTEYGAMGCPHCDNTIDVSSYDYWIDNTSNDIVDGTEMIECDGATKV